MNALERGILRSLRDWATGVARLEQRVDRLERKVERLEDGRDDYAPAELLERLRAHRARLAAIR